MIGLQIIGISIALTALYMSYLYFRRSDFNKLEFTIWALIWCGFITITITPSTFSFMIKPFGFVEMLDFIIVLSIFVIYLFVFNNFVTSRRLQKRLESLIRDDALASLKNNSNQKQANSRPDRYDDGSQR